MCKVLILREILWSCAICKLLCTVRLGLGLGLWLGSALRNLHIVHAGFKTAQCNFQTVQLHKSRTTNVKMDLAQR